MLLAPRRCLRGVWLASQQPGSLSSGLVRAANHLERGRSDPAVSTLRQGPRDYPSPCIERYFPRIRLPPAQDRPGDKPLRRGCTAPPPDSIYPLALAPRPDSDGRASRLVNSPPEAVPSLPAYRAAL